MIALRDDRSHAARQDDVENQVYNDAWLIGGGIYAGSLDDDARAREIARRLEVYDVDLIAFERFADRDGIGSNAIVRRAIAYVRAHRRACPEIDSNGAVDGAPGLAIDGRGFGAPIHHEIGAARFGAGEAAGAMPPKAPAADISHPRNPRAEAVDGMHAPANVAPSTAVPIGDAA